MTNVGAPFPPQFDKILARFDVIRLTLQRKFQNPAINIELGHIQLNTDLFAYFESNSKQSSTGDSQQRIALLLRINKNLKEFLNRFVKGKLHNLAKEHHQMVESLTQLWSHYQKLIFCYNYIVASSMAKFCSGFYKVSEKYRAQLNDEVVGSIAVMGAIRLRKFIEVEFKALVKTFSETFCWFISEERKGQAIPKDMIKESLAFFQSCYLNHEASIQRDGQKISLLKKTIKQLPANLKSQDHKFFEQMFLPSLLSSVSFYNVFVKEEAPKLTASDEILKMKNILKQETIRADEYIHQNNRQQYQGQVNKVLILQSITNRIIRPDGLKKYLSGYNPIQEGVNEQTKIQFHEQLKNFWEVYSRVLNHPECIEPIKNIYAEYLLEEGKLVQAKINKYKEFIDDLIKIYKKNNQILEIFGRNFQLKNMLKNNLTKMMSDNLIVDNQKKTVNFRGAKNLALYIDFKFKAIYTKPNDKKLLSDTIADIVSIFKILTQKDTFFKDHQKLTAIRLIEEVDFNKEDEFLHINNLQYVMLNHISNQIGLGEVKCLTEILRDMGKSNEETKKIKNEVNAKFHEFNQLTIKGCSYWTESTVYEIENPPNLLIKMMESVRTAMSQRGQIKFELNQGVSMIKGTYLNKTQQIFQIRNIYVLILLFLDQENGKKLKFGDLKMKIKSIGSLGMKRSKNNQLETNMIELLHIGLVRSNKQLKQNDKTVGKVLQSDQFQLNLNFNYEEQQKRQKRAANTIKKFKKINTQQLTILPIWLDKALKEELKQLRLQQEDYSIMKKHKIKRELVKMLKHAHEHKKLCQFDDFVKTLKNDPKMKEYPTNHRQLKEIVQQLINQGICQRFEDQRNTFKYIA